MRRTTIKPKRLYELAQGYLATRPVTLPNPKGGRPRTYDDALILTIASIQNLNQYSFREALEYCEDHFPDLPALSTYHDRLAQFTPDKGKGYVLGDKGFDSHRIMATITRKGYRPVIPLKRSGTVRDPLRMQSQKNADHRCIYKQRTLVEGLFGNIKQKLSSHVRIFGMHMAQLFALLRFALLNVSVLVAIEQEIILWI